MRELLNYREAFNLVSEYVGGGDPITEGLIRDIHKKLVEGVRGGEGQPGQYRKIQNYVGNSRTKAVIYLPPPPGEVPALMQDLVAWLGAETAVHPVLVAGLAQFQLVQIHPFVDGNGRTSRLLSTLCLYRSGYDFKRLFTLSEYYDRDRSQFYQALQSVRERELDLTPWLEFFVDGLATQLNEVKARGGLAIRRDVLAIRRDVLVNQHRLNPRQAHAVEHLLQVGHIDLRTFQDLCPDGARRTLQRDLAGLEAKGLVVTEGGTNNLVYRLKGGG